jgi:uncharacterized membrane protein YkvA (DUF1232 family)
MRENNFNVTLSMEIVKSLRQEARHLNLEIYAGYLALKDPRVWWAARILLAFGLSYAISPADLIPDRVPVFGYLDDLVVVPLAIAFTYRLIPKAVLGAARLQSLELLGKNDEKSRSAREIVGFAWLLLAMTMMVFIMKFM